MDLETQQGDVKDVNKGSPAWVQFLILILEFAELIIPSDLGIYGSEVTAEAEGTRIKSESIGSRSYGPSQSAQNSKKKTTNFLI